jgi:hypothetical protein
MTTTATTTFEQGKATLELARRITLKMVDDIPKGKLCYQVTPGCNPATWLLGHRAYADSAFPAMLGDRPPLVDEKWKSLFADGSTPVDDPSVYPPFEEVKATAEKTRAALLEWFESMDEAQLQSPLPDELLPFAPTFGELMRSLAYHEGFHAGQLSCVRRALGLPLAMSM